MSYRSGHYSEYPHHHPHDHGRAPPPPCRASRAAAAAIDGDGYTIVHAGKQVRLGPVVFWIVVGTIDRCSACGRRRPPPISRFATTS